MLQTLQDFSSRTQSTNHQFSFQGHLSSERASIETRVTLFHHYAPIFAHLCFFFLTLGQGCHGGRFSLLPWQPEFSLVSPDDRKTEQPAPGWCTRTGVSCLTVYRTDFEKIKVENMVIFLTKPCEYSRSQVKLEMEYISCLSLSTNSGWLKTEISSKPLNTTAII